MGSFSEHFISDTLDVLARLDVQQVEDVAAVLATTRERQGRLFLCGSGGGAGHASHATCDFRKLAGFEAYCVTDNVSELTARTNDDGWDSSYAAWLTASRLGERDCLFVFSVGGGDADRDVSTNLVRAMQLAREVGADIVGVAGRDGGALAQLASACIVVPTADPALLTPQVEGIQAVLWHLLVSHPRLQSAPAKWESMDGPATDTART